MDEYNANSITNRKWPELTQTTDLRWQRIWEINLAEDLNQTIDLNTVEAELSNHEIWVTIKPNNKTLQVTVITDRWGWDDDLIGYSYKLLGILEDRMGEISTIQGQQRDVWPPWFWKKNQIT